MKAGVEPGAGRDLSRLRAVGSTGSPLSPEGFRWIYEHVGEDTWLFSTSGGTDLCTAFVGGCPLVPVYEGELQARSLGAAVESWDPDGEPHIGEVGELVITEPMPSMPLYLWNDPDGERYRETYFDMYPGVWRHGDWIEITERGTAIISGRSDSTINRGGIRMGTAEIYRAVLAVDEVTDALVVDMGGWERRSGEDWMPLFVVLRDGAELDDDLVKRDPDPHPRGLLAAPRPGRDRRRQGGPAHAVGQGARAAGQAHPDGHDRRRRRPAATRWRTRPRWTSSSAGPSAVSADAADAVARRERLLERARGQARPRELARRDVRDVLGHALVESGALGADERDPHGYSGAGRLRTDGERAAAMIRVPAQSTETTPASAHVTSITHGRAWKPRAAPANSAASVQATRHSR